MDINILFAKIIALLITHFVLVLFNLFPSRLKKTRRRIDTFIRNNFANNITVPFKGYLFRNLIVNLSMLNVQAVKSRVKLFFENSNLKQAAF